MERKSTATRSNLLKTQATLSFSKQGFGLLDKKRNVLIRELMDLLDEASDLEERADKVSSQAFSSLQLAQLTLGRSAVLEFSKTLPEEEDFTLLLHSVMGVEIPSIQAEVGPVPAPYGFFRTNASLDQAVASFHKLKNLLYELAVLEERILRLADAIASAKKRANALEKIRIPALEKEAKWMEETLEEREREDFFRLKRIKGRG